MEYGPSNTANTYRVIFNNTITDPSALYNTTTGVLTILEDGNYTFDLNGIIRVTGITVISFVGRVEFQVRDSLGNAVTLLTITPPLNGATPSIDMTFSRHYYTRLLDGWNL